MSTNYYLPQDCSAPCEHCSTDELHIGKKSTGWTFSFRGHPSLGIRSRKDWEQQVSKAGSVRDEYGRTLTPAEFWDVVDSTRASRSNKMPPLSRVGNDQGNYADPEGWDFADYEFC